MMIVRARLLAHVAREPTGSSEGAAEGSQWQAAGAATGQPPHKIRSPVRAAEIPASLKDAHIFSPTVPVAARLRLRSGACHWLPSAVPPGLVGRFRHSPSYYY